MTLHFELNEDRYVSLLFNLISEVKHLQNCPPSLIPEENRAIKHLLDVLSPYSVTNGGPLHIEHVCFVHGRGNLILRYPSEPIQQASVAFIGSHLDVVPANPSCWLRDPFAPTIEDGKVYGRGTTDCLGHVALITELFIQLAQKRPKLNCSVTAVLIASEESATTSGVGVDRLLQTGRLEPLKRGPVYWVDSADSHPRIGTAAVIIWRLTARGKGIHSSLPHRGINSLELAMDATAYLQKCFYRDFPPCPEESEYQFATPSTLKPTQMQCSSRHVNEIPEWTEVRGDARLTPFHSVQACTRKLQEYVAAFNEGKHSILPRGPSNSQCSVASMTETCDDISFRGQIEFQIEGTFKGVACDLTSDSFKYLNEATTEVLGESNPFSLCGSIPCVGDMKEAGFDLQLCGYGHSSVYHGDNEYCTVKNMANGLKILGLIIGKCSNVLNVD